MTSGSKLIDASMAYTREDRFLSWYYFITTLLAVAAAFSGILFFEHPLTRLAFSLSYGLVMVRLFVIYHDFQHGALLRGSIAARIFMNAFGTLTLAPPSIWSETHEHHHHNNSKFSTFVVGSFPVISATAYRGLSRAGKLKYTVLRHPLMILFAYIPIFLVSFCIWPFVENPRRYFDCGIAVVCHALLYALLIWAGGIPAMGYGIIIPSLVMYAIGGYLFYAQHNFPGVRLQESEAWDYFEAALHSSSHIRMNRLMNWITANIGYHHVHHVNSRIPFYRLPEAMQAMPALRSPRVTSLRPAEIWKCLQLKLWDAERGRLISMKEYHAFEAGRQ